MSNRFQILKERIKGPVFSVITPFDKDGEIDFESLSKYLERVYSSGGRIFYVMAYNSRFSELSWDEIKQLNHFVVKKVKKLNTSNIVIVADPIHCSTKISIEFCSHAEDIGADLISLIFREKFYSENQIYQHFLQCANSTNIGILIHEMPFISGLGGHTINWPISLLDKLADIQNLIAIKEDAKDDKYSYDVINCLKERLSIIISGGGKRQWLRFSEIGCDSWLNGIGVFEPCLPIIFYESYLKGDKSLMNLILEKIEDPFFKNICNNFGWHIGIKAAMETRNIFPRFERMPLLPLDNEQMELVKIEMNKIEPYIDQVKEIYFKNKP